MFKTPEPIEEPKRKRNLNGKVRCPGCQAWLYFDDEEQQPDDAIEDHTGYGCPRPDPIVLERVKASYHSGRS
jgi:hypothetical protein